MDKEIDHDSSIWTEKYRPKEFSEVFGQNDIIKRVESLTKAMNIPHLLFAGPAGVGKSTLALVVEKKDNEKVLQKIAKNENLTMHQDVLEIIYEGSEGDCRRSINLLQSTAAISPSINPDLVSTMIANTKPKD